MLIKRKIIFRESSFGPAVDIKFFRNEYEVVFIKTFLVNKDINSLLYMEYRINNHEYGRSYGSYNGYNIRYNYGNFGSKNDNYSQGLRVLFRNDKGIERMFYINDEYRRL